MSGASGRVLVVDDSSVIRQLIKVNLELEGFEVVTAADGVECLECVHLVRPDVVTLDVTMPRLDGLRTAERLRSDPRTRHIPAAIISGCTQGGFTRTADGMVSPAGAVWRGVDAFLPKPFEPADLVRTVRRLISCGGDEDGRDGLAPDASHAAQGHDVGTAGSAGSAGHAAGLGGTDGMNTVAETRAGVAETRAGGNARAGARPVR